MRKGLDLTTETIMARNPPHRTHINAMRVTKRAWYDVWGGFTNSRCFRRQRKNGAWQYFVALG